MNEEVTLMEVVESGKQAEFSGKEPEAALGKVDQLQKLGFTTLADKLFAEVIVKQKRKLLAEHKYIMVSEDHIQKFLMRWRDKEDAKYAQDDAVKRANFGGSTQATSMNGFLQAVWGMSAFEMVERQNAVMRNQWMQTSSTPMWTDTSITMAPMQIQPGRLMEMPTAPPSFFERINVLTGNPKRTLTERSRQRSVEYCWNEVSIKEYAGCPPDAVLESLKLHKERGIFDEFTVATVSMREVKDPLLLGVVHGIKERAFLAQWGDDVSLDDII